MIFQPLLFFYLEQLTPSQLEWIDDFFNFFPFSTQDCGRRVKGIWHTSSKGMPRHAHRRWALMYAMGRRLKFEQR